MKVYGWRKKSSWELLGSVLTKEYGFVSLPPSRKTERGKPYFPNYPELCFNLSDSGDYALCAVSAYPVGVDIEQMQSRPRGESLFSYALTETEYERFQKMGGDWPAFYTLWTRKEAWAKYTGEGIFTHWKEDLPDGLLLRSYAGDGWYAAVCGEEAPPEQIIWWEEEA